MAASWSGSSQMWNWKSGVSLRSSARMASQISSGCVGTGGRDPPQGLAEELFTEEGRAGEKCPRCPRLGECTTAQIARSRLRRGGSAKRGKTIAAGLGRAVDRKCTGGCPAILYPGVPAHEAHLPAQEAQARTHP